MLTRRVVSSSLAMFAVGMLSACGGGDASSNAPGPKTPENPGAATTKQLDATAGGRGVSVDDPANKFTYFNLSMGEVVELTDDEAETSTDWHIAFKRAQIKLNGGVSGPGSVSGAIADAQEDYYDAEGEPNNSVFLNATADLELISLEAVTDVSELDFASDRHIAAIIGDFGDDSLWLYNPITHVVTADPDQWWLVRSSTGDSYAKFHATNLVKTDTAREITLEMFVQGVGESNFSGTAITPMLNIPLDGGSACYDFDAATEVDCSSNNWDVEIEYSNRSYNVWTNGGVSGDGQGAAFGPVETADIDDYVSGTVNGSGHNFSAHYISDSVGGLFNDDSWYAYSLQGNHKLWPNYRVYAIDTGSAQYVLQVLSFYNETGTSGWITIRYKGL